MICASIPKKIFSDGNESLMNLVNHNKIGTSINGRHGGPPLLGAHFSIAKGLEHALYEAKAYGCDTLQLFTKNSLTWKERILSAATVDRFKRAKSQTGLHLLAAHMSYLINLASFEEKKHAMSCNAVKQELIRCSQLDIPYAVLHPGSHMEKGEMPGMIRIVESINGIFAETPDVPTRLLLETTAGQGSSLGHTFETLAFMMEKVKDRSRIGICLDTCHIFAAGYDIRSRKSYDETMNTFESIIGMHHLYLIHLNDSKKRLGSGIDRHEHIGRGHIGSNAFEYVMNDPRLRHIPKILETPKGKNGEDWDKVNLDLLRALVH